MLEPPDLPQATIVECLQLEYGLHVAHIAFLPLGTDPNTAVYRAIADDATPYFVKLRHAAFDEIAVALPRFLSDQGIRQIIAPIATRSGRLWAGVGALRLIAYPFVEGRNGYEVDLSDRHWRAFGAALRRVHGTVLPNDLSACIRRETYSPEWRAAVRAFLEGLDTGGWVEPVAVKLASFLRAKRGAIHDLIGQAERLAVALEAQVPETVVCHSDLHAGNLLVGADDALYIVDWDVPIHAFKERDLMFVGGSQGYTGHTAQEEEALFYEGYGPAQINPVALAYYRYERIVEDIAIFCNQLLLTNDGGADRAQSLAYLMSNFLPDNTIDIAYASDLTRPLVPPLPRRHRKSLTTK